ncbi:MAG: Bax inhibitor-1 family protein, partial [Ignavibacteriales bacterium]|nr:Bax inhibitor-1 family protein [Ignavibacteriales bacterium]
ISFVGVVLFVGLTAYDTQKIKNMAGGIDAASEDGKKASIMGALTLYLDFINLFLFLLRLLGRRN